MKASNLIRSRESFIRTEKKRWRQQVNNKEEWELIV
jgi:hypothetical protein